MSKAASRIGQVKDVLSVLVAPPTMSTPIAAPPGLCNDNQRLIIMIFISLHVQLVLVCRVHQADLDGQSHPSPGRDSCDLRCGMAKS